ncbi:hypothetical protein GV828_07645 [Flavobacterium sp. NST-5]|uniref:DUF4294 domain-containing protein n=1 Tax=Flavobacterium ichthyis TaxID=2698827 RepID=A0ABW9ZDA2_9FLAO|nr:hypothetical protein [Flavobacterium ichthyis]NBL65070.1 hypothetical protein [Flavobacterium ichthyis]
MKKALFIFSMLLTLSVGSFAKTTLSVKDVKIIDRSGEQIFREVIFFEGEVFTMNLPAFRDLRSINQRLTPEQRSARSATFDKIIELIKKQDASYFANFKSKILSDNPYTVIQAITEARSIVATSIGLVEEYNQIENYMITHRDRYDLTKDEDYNRLKSDLRSQYNQRTVDNKMARVVIYGGIVIDPGQGLLYMIAIVLPMPPVVGGSQLFTNNVNMLEYESFVRQVITRY